MEAFYGVTPEQSAQQRLRGLYAGCRLARRARQRVADVLLQSRLEPHGAVTVRALQGALKASPIVTEDLPVSGLLAVGYKF